jgi:hypothetical protein
MLNKDKKIIIINKNQIELNNKIIEDAGFMLFI